MKRIYFKPSAHHVQNIAIPQIVRRPHLPCNSPPPQWSFLLRKSESLQWSRQFHRPHHSYRSRSPHSLTCHFSCSVLKNFTVPTFQLLLPLTSSYQFSLLYTFPHIHLSNCSNHSYYSQYLCISHCHRNPERSRLRRPSRDLPHSFHLCNPWHFCSSSRTQCMRHSAISLICIISFIVIFTLVSANHVYRTACGMHTINFVYFIHGVNVAWTNSITTLLAPSAPYIFLGVYLAHIFRVACIVIIVSTITSSSIRILSARLSSAPRCAIKCPPCLCMSPSAAALHLSSPNFSTSWLVLSRGSAWLVALQHALAHLHVQLHSAHAWLCLFASTRMTTNFCVPPHVISSSHVPHCNFANARTYQGAHLHSSAHFRAHLCGSVLLSMFVGSFESSDASRYATVHFHETMGCAKQLLTFSRAIVDLHVLPQIPTYLHVLLRSAQQSYGFLRDIMHWYMALWVSKSLQAPSRANSRRHESLHTIAWRRLQLRAMTYCQALLRASAQFRAFSRTLTRSHALSRALTCFYTLLSALSNSFIRLSVAAHFCASCNLYFYYLVLLNDSANCSTALLCKSSFFFM